MRASRSVSRGPTWVSWLGYISWASWPRCYVAGLFDSPNTVPPVPALVPDRRLVARAARAGRQPLLARRESSSPACASSTCAAACSCRPEHIGRPLASPSAARELRLVSLADRAMALQLLRFSLDRDGIDVTLEANFAMAGLGMEPMQLDRISVPGARRAPARAWRWRRRVRCEPWRVRSSPSGRSRCAGCGAGAPWPDRWLELDRLVAVARADRRADDPAPPAADALARSRALGWRAVLAAHETAWQQRWDGERRPSSRVTTRCSRRCASPSTI